VEPQQRDLTDTKDQVSHDGQLDISIREHGIDDAVGDFRQ
jgi:hypothetical protein